MTELDKPKFTKKQLTYLQELMTVACCHTTGAHDPTHFENRKYVCEYQKADTFNKMRETLGLKLIARSNPRCYWCNHYPKKKKGEGEYIED